MIPKTTLDDRVRYGHVFYCMKHGRSDDVTGFVDTEINALSNVELLAKISDALEELLEDRVFPLD